MSAEDNHLASKLADQMSQISSGNPVIPEVAEVTAAELSDGGIQALWDLDRYIESQLGENEIIRNVGGEYWIAGAIKFLDHPHTVMQVEAPDHSIIDKMRFSSSLKHRTIDPQVYGTKAVEYVTHEIQQGRIRFVRTEFVPFEWVAEGIVNPNQKPLTEEMLKSAIKLESLAITYFDSNREKPVRDTDVFVFGNYVVPRVSDFGAVRIFDVECFTPISTN